MSEEYGSLTPSAKRTMIFGRVGKGVLEVELALPLDRVPDDGQVARSRGELKKFYLTPGEWVFSRWDP